jgi:hypothetical protein
MTAPDFFNLDSVVLKVQPDPATHYLQFFCPKHPLANANPRRVRGQVAW